MKNRLIIFLALQRDLIVGGQAVMEGVMMRTPSAFAVAVRRRDGSIARTAEKLPRLTDKYPLLKTPILRGGATLIQSMALGIKALNFSANIAHEDSLRGSKTDETPSVVLTDAAAPLVKPKQSMSIVGSIIFALGFNVLLFIVAPLVVTNILFIAAGWATAPDLAANANWLQTVWAYIYSIKPASWLAFNLIDGLVRMLFFVTMILSLSWQKEIRRVFEYHGAEHKAVFAWEKNQPLVVANTRPMPRLHPRCGTSFLMIVMLVSIVLFSIIKFDVMILNLLVRILLLPVVAGISYEIIRLAAKNEQSLIFRFFTAPGLWLQLITTQEPDDTQLEVALEALKESLKLEPQTESETAVVLS